MYVAFVDDGCAVIACRHRALELVGLGVVRQVQGGCDQAAHIDLRPRAEIHAGRVDQPDLAGGAELAEDARTVGVADAVDGHGRDAGLNKFDNLSRADIELLPIQRRFVTGLCDGGEALPALA